MNFFRSGKLRLLYLLGLAQLLGGPLVLLQITTFCKLALIETPHHGIKAAAISAWQSDGFQLDLASTNDSRAHKTKSLPLTQESKLKLEKTKLPVITWEISPIVFLALTKNFTITDCMRTWTPAWPQAPPGPPPRLG